jgi:hypothetical protein
MAVARPVATACHEPNVPDRHQRCPGGTVTSADGLGLGTLGTILAVVVHLTKSRTDQPKLVRDPLS